MTEAIEAEALRRPIRDRLEARKAEAREKIVLACITKGASRGDAEATLEELESDRPLLDWLIAGGFEKIVALILRLLGLSV